MKDKHSLVEQHAMDRLDKVQEEREQAYKKRPHHFHFSRLIMVLVMLVVVITMVYSLFAH